MRQEVLGLQEALALWPCWLDLMLLWSLNEVSKGVIIHHTNVCSQVVPFSSCLVIFTHKIIINYKK